MSRVSQAPTMCANNCGFFGSPERNNYCSKCFNLKKQAEEKANASPTTAPVAAPPAASPSPSPTLSTNFDSASAVTPLTLDAAAAASPSPSTSTSSPSPAPEKKKGRCFTCNRKVGLLGFECRCDNVFCAEHRYTYTHNCTFNVKSLAANNITKANPKLSTAKLDKI